MDIFVILLLWFERNPRHFHLVSWHWSLHRTSTLWLKSADCQCCIPLRLARVMPDTIKRFPEVIEVMEEALLVFFRYFSTNSLELNICSVVLLRGLKPACSSSKICSACSKISRKQNNIRYMPNAQHHKQACKKTESQKTVRRGKGQKESMIVFQVYKVSEKVKLGITSYADNLLLAPDKKLSSMCHKLYEGRSISFEPYLLK